MEVFLAQGWGEPRGCGEALPRGPATIPAPAFVCGRPRGHGGPGLWFLPGSVPRSAPPLCRGEVEGGSGCVRGKAAGDGFTVPRPVSVTGSWPLPGESGVGSEEGEKHLEGSCMVFFCCCCC